MRILTPDSYYDQVVILATPGEPIQAQAVRVWPIAPDGSQAEQPVAQPLPLAAALSHLMQFCTAQAVALADAVEDSGPKLEVAP